MSMTTEELESTLRELLAAQASVVDVSAPRPALAPADAARAPRTERDVTAEVVSLDAHRSRAKRVFGSVVAIASAAAVIAGVVAIRANQTQRATITTGTGLEVEIAAPPLVEYELSEMPAGIYEVESRTEADDEVGAICMRWVVLRDRLRCSSLAAAFVHWYTDSGPVSAETTGELGFLESNERPNLSVTSSRGLLESGSLQMLSGAERVTVRGTRGWFTPMASLESIPAGVPVPLGSSLTWRADDGMTVTLTYYGPRELAPSREEMIELANGMRRTTGIVPDGPIALSAGTVSFSAADTVIKMPAAVSGPDDAPCSLSSDPCVGFQSRPGSRIAFAEGNVWGPLYHAMFGMTDDGVAAVRVEGDGEPFTVETTSLPGYEQRFVVVNVPEKLEPTHYVLLDNEGQVLERKPIPSSLQLDDFEADR